MGNCVQGTNTWGAARSGGRSPAIPQFSLALYENDGNHGVIRSRDGSRDDPGRGARLEVEHLGSKASAGCPGQHAPYGS